MPRPATITTVLFDCDGVLVDSEPLAARRNMHIFHILGVPVTYMDCIAFAGSNGAAEIPEILQRYGSTHTYKDFLEVRTDPHKIGETYDSPELKVYDGLVALLARLRANGVQLGLVSTTACLRIVTLLNRFGLTHAFDAIVCGDMVKRHKPDPEPYQYALRILGASPDTTVVFEDSPLGIQSARSAGAYVIGVCASLVTQDVSAANEVLDSYVGFELMPSSKTACTANKGVHADTNRELSQ